MAENDPLDNNLRDCVASARSINTGDVLVLELEIGGARKSTAETSYANDANYTSASRGVD
jgi:hypothetical protein